mmetsp:Transcript_39108/g.117577  ORF Transcript_39108/g.117577 Transcript_39108/m.117577 type:complete len:82 (+) Transcript_39108:294-539(+)
MTPPPASLSDAFVKRCDPRSGRMYHIRRATGEATWDAPHSVAVPLEGPPEEVIRRREEERRTIVEEKGRRSRDRLAAIGKI